MFKILKKIFLRLLLRGKYKKLVKFVESEN